MPIRNPKDVGIEHLRQAVPRIIHRHQLTSGNVLGALGGSGRPMDLAGQHLVFVANVDDALSPGLLNHAHQFGRRYFVLQGDQPVATAQLADGDETGLRLSNVTFGDLAQSTAAAIKVAEALEKVRQDDYELRVLEIPPLYLNSLWLHSDAHSILIPMAPAPSPLQANRPYEEAEFEAVVEKIAKRRRGEPELAGSGAD